MNEKPTIISMPGGKTKEIYPSDSWAQVELFRWQHGKLPNDPSVSNRRLHEPTALRAMADGIESALKPGGDRSKIPPPFSVCEVLRYCARRLDKESKTTRTVEWEDAENDGALKEFPDSTHRRSGITKQSGKRIKPGFKAKKKGRSR